MNRPVVWRFAPTQPEATEPAPFDDDVVWFTLDDASWSTRLGVLQQSTPPEAICVDLGIGTLPLQTVMRSLQILRAVRPVALVVEASDATSLAPMLLERVISQATLVVMFNAAGVLNTLSADLCEAGAQAAAVLGASRWRVSMHTPQAKALLDASLNGPKAGFSVTVATHALANGFCHADAVVLALSGACLPDLYLDCPTATPPFLPAFAELSDARLGLYAIVDTADWIERVLAAGVRTVQLRAKQGSPEQLSEEIRRSVQAAEAAGAQLFINDHWKLALQHGAYGVHLGQEDTLTADLGALRAAGVRVGLSSHCAWEVARAQALKPSYIACGPIHATVTKDMPWWPQGNGNLAYWCKVLASTPVVAIAGMDEARSTEAVQCGAAGVAVLRGIVQAADLGAKVAQLKGAVDAGRVLERIKPPEWPRSTLAGPVPPPRG
jgi:hydroxymethylpyrimidine kinase/phosphomethylpyrimidine kinase/thiamine-phosphate diphosphorylase